MAGIHPDVAALLEAARAAGSLPYEAMRPDEARRVHALRREMHQQPAEPVSERRDFSVDGPVGPIPLRLYRPLEASPQAVLPCLVFMHGGGWVLGSLESHDALCCHLSNQAACCVIAIDYRLAPEHPFPAAVDDCVAAYRAIVDQAAALGIRQDSIAVGGDSAGANLAAVLALMGRDGTLPAPVQQTLVYPVADIDQDLDDYGPRTGGMLITGATMVYFRDHYLPDAADRKDWRASPIKAESLAGTAPALVIVCGHDPLKNEGLAYAERLEQDGVDVTLLRFSDLPHGVITMTNVVSAAGPMQDFVAASLRDAFLHAPRRRPGV